MKRLADLTIQDLSAEPVWRYEGGSGTDAVVVAERRESLSQSDDEVFLAATEFLLPDSSEHLGFCFPVDAASVDYLQPVIVTPSGHVQFWFDGMVTREALAAQWSALGKKEEEVFPVRFSCRVPVDGRAVAGVIPGVETSADVTPVHPAELAEAPRVTGDPYRFRQPGAVLGARPARVRRQAAGGPVSRERAPRHNAEWIVEFEQGGARGDGVTGNLSQSGIFVRTARPASRGPAVSLTVHLPGGRELLLKGWVVRSASASGLSRSAGFGLALSEKSEEYERLLARFLESSK